jgi:hypothetical protein
MGWTGHVARMEERRNTVRSVGEKLRERNNLKDLDVEKNIILKWIFKEVGREGID